jgi:hypothetical protein
MEFYNATNTALGLCQDVDFLCGSTTASYPLADKVRNINQAYLDVNRLIWESCDSWQYDDANNTDVPRVITSLTSGTGEYSIPSTAQKIRRIEVKDVNGKWIKLQPIDYQDINYTALPEYLSANGLPIYYDLIGDIISLYPTPSDTYTSTTSAMAVYIDRDVTLFTTASTTSVPGFATPFHRILSLQGAIDFEKDENQKRNFMVQKSDLVAGLKKFYNSREVEKRTTIKPHIKRAHRAYE